MTLDTLCLMIMAGNLAKTRTTIDPGERLTIRRYLRRRIVPLRYARETAAELRAGEFLLWIDGRIVVDPDTPVLIERDSRVLVCALRGERLWFIEPDFVAALN
jgi:hypothetical protein